MRRQVNILFFVMVMAPVLLQARGVYQTTDEFINGVFAGDPPASKKLWLNQDLKDKIRVILGHDLNVLRLRYWRRDDQTAWILDEIGKERPITTGIAVKAGKIEVLKILIFRESRGWEVRYPFFTDQFKQATLTGDNQLDAPIDGISGATLSVNAVTKLARLALMFDRYVMNNDDFNHGDTP